MENNRINERDRAFADAFSQFVNGKMASASPTTGSISQGDSAHSMYNS